MRRVKLRLKTVGWKTTGARTYVTRTMAGVLAAGLMMAAGVQGVAQDASTSAPQQPAVATTPISGSKIGPAAPVTYDNKYEIYGGLNFMNFMGGQHLPKRMNMGGGEVLATYWVTKKLGAGLDYRGEAGTTPVFASAGIYNLSRPLVYMNMLMAGAEYRGPKNQYVAIDYHAFFGASKGVFDVSRSANEPFFFSYTGLYTNRTKPIAALGGSLDFNISKNMAVRLAPDLILEHFGTGTRQFVAVSGGVIYRFGKR